MITVTLLAGLLATGAAALAYKRWPRGRRGLYEERHADLRDDMRRRRLSPSEQADEMAFRRALAELRRRASDHVKRSPSCRVREEVSTIAVEISKRMTDRDVARRFLKAVRDGDLADILYEDALAALAAEPRKPPRPISDDELAAVTTNGRRR